MDIDAQALLRNHKVMEARLSVIRARILKAETLRRHLNEEVIQAMAFEHRPLDGLPARNSKGSRTEYLALHYQERILKEQKARERDIQWLRIELAEVEEKIALHDAVLRSLNDAEVLLVRLHYDETLPFSRIAEMQTLPNVPWNHSISTMKRMNLNILRKVNEVLRPLCRYHLKDAILSESEDFG